jgi:hypothetical protein
LYGAHDLDGLVDYVVRALPRLVRCDHAVHNEANLRRCPVVWREYPALSPALPRARRIFERHMRDHPLVAHPEWDGRAVKTSDFLTRPRLHDLASTRSSTGRSTSSTRSRSGCRPRLPRCSSST